MNSETRHFAPSVRQMAAAALMTALMCLLGPLSIPVGAVPVSLTNFVLYLAVYLIGTKYSFISYCAYLLLGMCGLPVFSGYSGGLAKLAGPTGGYLVGFFFLILISGAAVKKSGKKTGVAILGMTLGTLVAYAFGTAWFILEAECSLQYALAVCVYPFLIGDAVKILAASKAGPLIRGALSSAGLFKDM